MAEPTDIPVDTDLGAIIEGARQTVAAAGSSEAVSYTHLCVRSLSRPATG